MATAFLSFTRLRMAFWSKAAYHRCRLPEMQVHVISKIQFQQSLLDHNNDFLITNTVCKYLKWVSGYFLCRFRYIFGFHKRHRKIKVMLYQTLHRSAITHHHDPLKISNFIFFVFPDLQYLIIFQKEYFATVGDQTLDSYFEALTSTAQLKNTHLLHKGKNHCMANSSLTTFYQKWNMLLFSYIKATEFKTVKLEKNHTYQEW